CGQLLRQAPQGIRSAYPLLLQRSAAVPAKVLCVVGQLAEGREALGKVTTRRTARSEEDMSLTAYIVALSLALVPLLGNAADTQAHLCTDLEGERIRFIVPNAPGGGYDAYSRLIAPALAERLGARVRVENIEEGGGIVGAATIRGAEPDGRTIGILNGPGLLAAILAGQSHVPDPTADFTVLARIARSRHVWVTAANSPLEDMDDVFELIRERPLVYATRDVASISFLSINLGAAMLDIPIEAVAGYKGSADELLALLRGDVDIMSVNYASMTAEIEGGDIKALLQIADETITPTSALAGV